MILNDKQQMVAYRCPECGSAVKSMVGIFSLTADMIKLKCPCGGSEMEIVRTKDKKLRLSVPCIACPSPHTYNISSEMFFGRDLTALSCTFSGLDTCFIGTEKKVEKALEKSEEELKEMLGDTSLEALTKNRGGDGRELIDPSILDMIDYAVAELQDEDAIRCDCPDKGDYEVIIHDTTVEIRCKQCGCAKIIPAGSYLAAEDFLNASMLDLRSSKDDDDE